MRNIHYGRTNRGLANRFRAFVVGVGLVSIFGTGGADETERSARQEGPVPEASARQKDAFQRIDAHVSQLSKDDRPFNIQRSGRKVESSIDVVAFLDDVYDLHDASGDGGFELVKETSFDGGMNYQFRRLIDGIPVRGTNTVVTVGTDGFIISAIGVVYRASERNINTPTILWGTAFESCRAKSNSKFVENYDWSDKLELAFQPIEGELRLGWYGHVRDSRDLARVECFIDAKTGRTEVSKQYTGALNRSEFSHTGQIGSLYPNA